MKKIPCLFQRDFTDPRHPKLLDTVTPGCEWVLAGQGVATVKRDGTACLVREGRLYRRYDAKRGKTPPKGFLPAQEPDPVTGHWPGWIEVNVENPKSEDVWHALAWAQALAVQGRGTWSLSEGTWELCGPKIGNNHERLDHYEFFRHGTEFRLVPRNLEEIRAYVTVNDIEGLVFWRSPGDVTGDLCKITREQLGLPWPLV